MSRLSLKEQVGQLIMVGSRLGHAPTVGPVVRAYDLGGVFFGGRTHQSAASLRQTIAAFQTDALASSGIKLQISLDQEGGEVQTLQGPDFPPIPTAVAQGTWSAATLRTQTTAWSRRLTAIGVTLDLAPVADTVPPGTASKNPPIGSYKREYDSDPADVATDIATVVRAAQSTGMLTTLKHFPGLGRVTANTDDSTAAIDTVATTTDPFLAPFAAGISAGSGAVMISLASYPKLDARNIAAFSPAIVTGLLRGKLHFTGLIMSDDLGDAVAVAGIPAGQRAIRFVQAGGDMVLTTSARDAGLMATSLLSTAQRSAGFAAQVKAATRSVIASKYRSGLLTCVPPKP
jgi:beta-N-acetylhexosaminidase